MVFVCISLIASDPEHYCMSLLAICISFFEKCPFLNCIVCFAPYILDSTLWQMCDIFSQLIWCLIFAPLLCQSFLSRYYSTYPFLAFKACTSVFSSNKSLDMSTSCSFCLLIFSFSHLMISCLRFSSLIHCELTFFLIKYRVVG